MDKQMKVAILLILLLNLFLLTIPFTRSNWDSETHLFFADHYRRGWFDPWEEKWFGGFWVYSYPPLTHQLIAVFSFPFGLEMGYKLVQGLTLLAFPLALWLLAKEVVGVKYAGWAVLLSTVVPGVYIVLYVFGQLPTFMAMVITLLAGTKLAQYLKTGKIISLLAWFGLVGAAAATHHHTVFIILPILIGVLILQQWISRPFSFSGWLLRPGIAIGLFAIAIVMAILPFWWWFFTQNLPQVEIPHTTRENIFRNKIEAEMFFWGMYGVLLPLSPFGLWAVVRRRALWPLGIMIMLLGVLGLGTRTSLPSILFQYQELWKWLTYERFTLWAAVLSVIPLSIVAERLGRGALRHWIGVPIAILFLLVAAREATFSLTHTILPRPLERWEETEIVKFLGVDLHDHWNYVTFGLGEAQLARLSRLTSARTVDGTYYTARWRNELRNSGIGIIDGSFWWGERSHTLLFPMLQRPWDWNLKWAIVAHPWVEKHLRNSGWSLLHPIGSDVSFEPEDPIYSLVTVWEAPDKIPIPEVEPGQQVGPPYYPQSSPVKQFFKQFLPYLWGILPLSFLAAGLVGAYWEVRRDLTRLGHNLHSHSSSFLRRVVDASGNDIHPEGV